MTIKFFKAVNDFKMLEKNDSVCVGVSGGADSMCLLHLLWQNRETLGITVAAAHVNHCIRGAEADRDEFFVRDFCNAHGIPFHSVKINIPLLAEKEGIGTELCARNKRYDYFDSLGYTKTATAHTGSDCVETMLMNLSRGSTLHGLCAIPPKRDRIIRPLIYFTREDTENYCKEHGIEYVTDSTNLTEDYTRNKFRHSVLALLKNINVSFEQNALRCISSLREDDAFLSDEAKKLFSAALLPDLSALYADKLTAAPVSVAKRCLAYYFSEVLHSDCEFKHINAFYDILPVGGAVTLPSGITVKCENGIISQKVDNRLFDDCPESIVLTSQNNFFGRFGKTVISVVFSDESPRKVDLTSNIAVLDADKVLFPVTIRSRKSGDEICLAGRNCTKSVKKLFTENKILAERRMLIPVFADDKDVICIPGFGISRNRTASNKTTKYMIIKTEGDKNDE